MHKPKAGKLKQASLAQAPIAVKRQVAFDPTDSVPTKHIKTASLTKPAASRAPDRLTYALKQFTAERRKDGWYICRTPFSAAGEKPEWSGAYETIETAVLAIGRRLATEIADRHTRHIETYKLKPGDPLHGLKLTTGLRKPATRKA